MTLRDIFGRELFRYEAPAVTGGAAPSAPGAGEAVPGVPAPPSAETQNTDGADGTPPGPIPYARFQEVNEARKAAEEAYQPYEELAELGYDAANLQRLVAWEQEYVQDPVGTWLTQAQEIENLPQEVKAAVLAAQGQRSAEGGTEGNLADGSPPPQGGSGQPEEPQGPPDWAKPLVEDFESRREREEQEAIRGFYDSLVNAWQGLDKKDGIVTPEESIHAHIAAASPNATSAEELLRNARETWLKVRESVLGAEIQVPGRTGTVPQSVPGGVGGSAPPVRPRTLREATRMAAADKSVNPAGT